MTTDVLRKRAQAFERGTCGQSLRELALAEWTPERIDVELLERGYRCRRAAIFASRDAKGQPRWRTQGGGTTASIGDASLASELVYHHEDGGVVRVFPHRSPSVAFDQQAEGPFARKSLFLAGPRWFDLAAEACVVTRRDNPLPRSLASADGLKTSTEDAMGSYELARAALSEHVIRILPGPAPLKPLAPGGGLIRAFTMSYGHEFGRVIRAFTEHARTRAWRTLERERHMARSIFFPGDDRVATRIEHVERCVGLASVTLYMEPQVVGVDLFGYDASVRQAKAFLLPFFASSSGLVVRDDVSGEDIKARLADELQSFFANS